VKQNITVNSEHSGKRIDIYMSEISPEFISRSSIQKDIRNGEITVNGKNVKPSYKIEKDDKIEFEFPDKPVIPEPQAEDINLDIIYQDSEIIVINKEPGVLVHPTQKDFSGTVVNGILSIIEKDEFDDVSRPGIVHRLDKNTSGVLIIAKNSSSLENLYNQFKNRVTQKCYIALVKGIPKKSRDIITLPIGRDPYSRIKMAVTDDGKESVTEYRVIKTFGDKASLVWIVLHTGRTHQIRVHFEHLGNPLLGDDVYGNYKEDFRLYGIKRQMLHALRLSVMHPVTQQKMTFTAKIPNDIKTAIKKLEGITAKEK